MSPNEEITTYIVEDFSKNGYVKDSKYIYKPSSKNRFHYAPVVDEYGKALTVKKYIGHVLGDVFLQYLHRHAFSVHRHVSAFLSMHNSQIRAYRPNRHLIAFKNGVLFTGSQTNRAWRVYSLAEIDANPEQFAANVGNTTAWSYIDNSYDFENGTVPLGDYGPVLDLQFGANQRARDQYLMLLFGRTAFPIGHLDQWRVCLATYGVSGSGKSTGIKLLKRIHGPGRFWNVEKASDMCMVHDGQMGWEVMDVDSLIKVEHRKLKKLFDETTGDFHAHPLLTLHFEPEKVDKELARRMVFCKFAHKPPHMNTDLIEHIASTMLLNILVHSLDVYHRTLQELEGTQQSLRDIIDPFFIVKS
ncbi:hypothetical protein GGF32_008299 [Allomyces javanicus]|nr:hypothetical protein GGF32_008299 [Allomyces javanicus]